MDILVQKALQHVGKERGIKTETETLLNTPIRDLRKPLGIRSQILDEVIYLVANEEMARQVEDEGRVAYTPEEIAVLSRKSKTVDWGEWVDFLKMLHHTKKTFLGSRIQP